MIVDCKAICLTLFVQADRRPASRAAWMAGNKSPMEIPMMAITTSSSTSVKPILLRIFISHSPTVYGRFPYSEPVSMTALRANVMQQTNSLQNQIISV